MNRNTESIRLLTEKMETPDGQHLLVRVALYDRLTCADFDYIPINELIKKLVNNELELRPEDLDTFIFPD
jgi:hypothetical protein